MTTSYVFVDTVNGGTPSNATPDTATSRYHTTSSWPANGARWASLNTALNNATITGRTDDVVVYCQGSTDLNEKAIAPSGMGCTSLTIIGDWATGIFDDTKFHIGYTGALGSCFENNVTTGNVTLQNVQFTYTGTSAPIAVRHNSASGSRVLTVDSCLVRIGGNNASAGTAIRNNGASGTMKVWNTIVYVQGTPGGDRWGIQNAVEAYNSICYGLVNGFASCTTVKNCVSFSNTDDFNSCTTINYCAMDDADAGTGNTNGKTWTNEFTDHVNGDFTLKAGSTLIGAGLDDPASGAFSDDITGAARSDWDIGAFEYVAAGSTITDVDTDETILAGQTTVQVTGTDLDTGSAARIISGGRSIPMTNYSAHATSPTFDVPNLAACLAAGIKFGSVTLEIVT